MSWQDRMPRFSGVDPQAWEAMEQRRREKELKEAEEQAQLKQDRADRKTILRHIGTLLNEVAALRAQVTEQGELIRRLLPAEPEPEPEEAVGEAVEETPEPEPEQAG
jgi:hypothetical protein